MAIENTYLLGKNITLGCGFDLQAKAPLDSRQTVPAFAGLQALIDGNAAYEGMIVYDEETKKTYQAQIVDDVLTFREFGINEAELKDLIASETTAAMEFKGAATALPENPAKGDMYKVTASFKVGEEDVKVGDSIVYDGEQWFIIPSGDDIEDTWRPVTGVDNDSTLTFVAGDKLEKTVAADGTITYKHVAIDAPEDMTAEDDEKTRTYITQLITDNHGHIIGFKTATENVEDTNTEYTFEGQSDEATSVYFQVTSNEEGASAEVVYLDAYSKNEVSTELAKKVDKVEGYSLVSDDEIARLAEVDNYDDEEVLGLIGDNAQAIEDLETYVGTIPTDDKYKDLSVVGYINKKAEETLAAAQGGSSETAASVKQQLDNYKSENDTRVKAAEDAIDAIEADYLKAADKTELFNAIAGEKTRAEGIEAGLRTDVDAIKGDYVKAADIADFETKENVKKVADDLAAEVKARGEADADFETRIATLEGNFGDGEGTVEAQIAAAVAAEKERAEGIEGGLRTDVNAVAGRMTTAEGKITALEGASATHATKEEAQGYADAKDEAITAAQSAANKAQEEVDALETYVGTIPTDEKYADIDNVISYVNKKAEETLAAAQGGSSETAASVKQQLDNYKSENDTRVKAAEDAIDAIEADYLKAADKTELDGKITANANAIELLTNGVSAEEVDGVNDLIQYVKDHGAEVTGMKANIAANAKAIEDHEALATETYETKEDASEKLAEAKEYADQAEADAISAAATDAQSKVDALANGQVKANTEAIATKANVTDVYAKTETFTKDEVNALIEQAHTWGSF